MSAQYAQLAEIGIALLAVVGTSLIQQAHWPDWANALVSVIIVLLASIGTAFLGGKLTGDIPGDVTIIVGAVLALRSVPEWQPFYDYVQAHVLVIKHTPDAPPPAPTIESNYPKGTPEPIILPPPQHPTA